MKYYTAFIYADTTEENPVHCTHRFLGGLRGHKVETVIAYLDGFFEKHKPTLPRLDFTGTAMFGPRNDIPVLVISLPFQWDREWVMLRAHLARYGPQDTWCYEPHVAVAGVVNPKPICEPFAGYALMSKNKIIKVWK